MLNSALSVAVSSIADNERGQVKVEIKGVNLLHIHESAFYAHPSYW